MQAKTSLLITLFLPLIAQAYGPYPAEPLGTIDGDTILVKFNLLPGQSNIYKIRQIKIDTPEKRSTSRRKVPGCEKEMGKLATQFTKNWLSDKNIVTISNIKKGMYFGRLLGDISYHGELLREALIKSGNARPYVDKAKDRKPWCQSPIETLHPEL